MIGAHITLCLYSIIGCRDVVRILSEYKSSKTCLTIGLPVLCDIKLAPVL